MASRDIAKCQTVMLFKKMFFIEIITINFDKYDNLIISM